MAQLQHMQHGLQNAFKPELCSDGHPDTLMLQAAASNITTLNDTASMFRQSINNVGGTSCPQEAISSLIQFRPANVFHICRWCTSSTFMVFEAFLQNSAAQQLLFLSISMIK